VRKRFTAYSAALTSALIREGRVVHVQLPHRLNNIVPLEEIQPAIPLRYD
jgi:hypothetical protein